MSQTFPWERPIRYHGGGEGRENFSCHKIFFHIDRQQAHIGIICQDEYYFRKRLYNFCGISF